MGKFLWFRWGSNTPQQGDLNTESQNFADISGGVYHSLSLNTGRGPAIAAIRPEREDGDSPHAPVLEILTRALSLTINQQYSDAERYYQRALDVDPEQPVVHHLRAFNLIGMRHFSSSELADVTPRSLPPSVREVEIVDKGEVIRITKEAERASNDTFTNRQKAAVKCGEALNYANSGNHAQAVKLYMEAIRLQPGEVLYLNNLAWSLHILGDNEKALTIVCVAEQLMASSKYSNLHDTKGCILRSLERYDEALEQFKLAYQYCKKEEIERYKPLGYCNIASIYLAKGEKQQAKPYIFKAKKSIENSKFSKNLDPDSKQFIEEILAQYDSCGLSSDRSSKEDTQGTILSLDEHRESLWSQNANSSPKTFSSTVFHAASAFKINAALNEFQRVKSEIRKMKQVVDVDALLLQKQQMAEIMSQDKLKEYYYAAIYTVSQAFTSAQVVAQGDVQLSTGDIKLTLAQRALSLIPFCGSVVADVAGDIVEFIQKAQLIKKANSFATVACDAVDLHDKVEPVIRAVVLDPKNKAKILGLKDEDENKHDGWFSKVVKFGKKLGQDITTKFYGDRYKTLVEIRAHEDICYVIDQWCERQVGVTSVEEAIELLKEIMASREATKSGDHQLEHMGDLIHIVNDMVEVFV